MRYKYAILNNENKVISIIDTPIKSDTNIEIEEFDADLLGSTYNKETDEFVKVLDSEE